MIDRSDLGPGDFDIEFNYDSVRWETGDASGGNNGLGGGPAHVGYSNGTGAPGTDFELAGSGVPGSLIDGGPNALVSHSINRAVAGRYDFFVRNGIVVPPPPPSPVPETGSTVLYLGFALTVLSVFGRRQDCFALHGVAA